MELTIKTQYGIKTFLDIAYHHEAGPVQRKHIMIRQGIPTDYLDLILTRLKDKGLIHSFRGREGGYHLAAAPNEISVWDIVSAVEDLKSKERIPENYESSDSAKYVTEPAIELLNSTIIRNLKRMSIETLLEEGEERVIEQGIDPVQLMESKPIAPAAGNQRIHIASTRTAPTSAIQH